MSTGNPKGIDDLLQAGGTPTVVPEDETDHVLAAIERSAQAADPDGDAGGFDDRRWPAPLGLVKSSDLPAFPTAQLCPWLKAYVDAEANATQTPAALPALSALATVAAAVQGVFVVEVKAGYREPLNLYVLVVQPPGSRKSQVFKDAVVPILHWEKAQAERLRRTVAVSLARNDTEFARLKLLKDQAAKVTEPEKRDGLLKQVDHQAAIVADLKTPYLPRLLADDVTPEAMASLLAEQDGRLAVISGESSLFDIMAGRYSSKNGSPNIDLLLRAHAGDLLLVDRKGRPREVVPAPALTLGLAVQPEVLQQFAKNSTFRGRGLTARFLYCLPPSTVGFRATDPPPVPDVLREEYERRVARLLELRDVPDGSSATPRVLHLSGEARSARNDFAETLEPLMRPGGCFEDISEWLSKLPGAAVRMAGLLHLAAHAGDSTPPPEIPAMTMTGAIEIAIALIPHAQEVLGAGSTSETERGALVVLRCIQRKGVAGISKQDLWQATKGSFPAGTKDFDQALDELERRHYIRVNSTRTRSGVGRPGKKIFVNPAVLDTGTNDGLN